MTNRLVQHTTVEESISIQRVKSKPDLKDVIHGSKQKITKVFMRKWRENMENIPRLAYSHVKQRHIKQPGVTTFFQRCVSTAALLLSLSLSLSSVFCWFNALSLSLSLSLSSVFCWLCSSSTMQNVIGPIYISHLHRTFFFFFIFSWPLRRSASHL